MRRRTREARADRASLARAAGIRKVSLVSVLAGALVASATFAMLAALAAAAMKAVGGLDDSMSAEDWRELGFVGTLVLAGALFLAYLFGGYVAGRMARRAGATNGFLVLVLGVVLATGAAELVELFGAGDDVARDLRELGVPTSAAQWARIATLAGLASLGGMVVGAVVGGAAGERWHDRLAVPARDPELAVDVPGRSTVDGGLPVVTRAEDEREATGARA